METRKMWVVKVRYVARNRVFSDYGRWEAGTGEEAIKRAKENFDVRLVQATDIKWSATEQL